jgi:hypothetical protein
MGPAGLDLGVGVEAAEVEVGLQALLVGHLAAGAPSQLRASARRMLALRVRCRGGVFVG